MAIRVIGLMFLDSQLSLPISAFQRSDTLVCSISKSLVSLAILANSPSWWSLASSACALAFDSGSGSTRSRILEPTSSSGPRGIILFLRFWRFAVQNVLAFDRQKRGKTAQDVLAHVRQQKEKLLVCRGNPAHGLGNKNNGVQAHHHHAKHGNGKHDANNEPQGGIHLFRRLIDHRSSLLRSSGLVN
jgi:hypothetical protein